MLDQQSWTVLRRLTRWLDQFKDCFGHRAQHVSLRQYIDGLLGDSARKSMSAMLARVSDPTSYQAFQHFITHAPWDATVLWRRLRAVTPERSGILILDETSFPKSGPHSVGVARQDCGALGKVANCQVAVTAARWTGQRAWPMGALLYLPEAWISDRVRRATARIPATVVFQEKWRLALEMLDEMREWGVRVPLAVADAGYGEIGEFRQGLEDRGMDYVVQVASSVTAYPEATETTTPPYAGRGPRPQPRYEQAAPSVKDLVLAAGSRAARRISWREGSRRRAGAPVAMRSRFVFLRVRPAGEAHRGTDLPVRWLIAEWPSRADEPTKYWISNLPPRTTRAELVRLAKLRWRIEHDYRELKDGLGLDHYEGRTWNGWHHHVTLASIAHAFLTLQRLNPKAHVPV